MTKSRRDFLKAIGLTAGTITAAGVAAPVVFSKTSELWEREKRDASPELFPALTDEGVVASEEIVTAMNNLDSVEPVYEAPRLSEGDPFDVSIWAREALWHLNENLCAGDIVLRNYTPEVANQGDVVNARRPGVFTIGRSMTQDVANNVSVPLEDHFFTRFLIKDGEYSKSWGNLTDMFIAPAMMAMARCIDMTIYERVLQSKAPEARQRDARELLLDARQTLNMNKAFNTGRHIFVSPELECNILRMPIAESGEQYRGMDKNFGRTLNFDLWSDPSIPHRRGLALHRDAVMMVNRPLPLPPEFMCMKSERDVRNDISMRVTMQYDVATSGTIVTLETLMGIAVLDPSMCVVLENPPKLGAGTFKRGNFSEVGDVNVKVKAESQRISGRELGRRIQREIRRSSSTNI